MSSTLSRSPRPGISGAAFDAADRAADLALGAATTGIALAFPREPNEGSRSIPSLLPSATAWLLVSVKRRVFDVIASTESHLAGAFNQLLELPGLSHTVGTGREAMRALLTSWAQSFESDQANRLSGVDEVFIRAGIDAHDRIIDALDMQQVMEGVLDRVDMDKLMAKVDIDALTARVDINAVLMEQLEDLQVGGLVVSGQRAIVNNATDTVAKIASVVPVRRKRSN